MIERDELSGIFDQLTPEDFVVPSTAIASMPGCYEGPDVLDGFVEHQLNAVRLAFAMADGWLTTTAVLAGPEGLRTFVADDEERLEDFLTRVRSEASRMQAHWCFLATQTVMGPDAREAVVWHLTSTEPETAGAVAGFLPIEGDRLGESHETRLATPVAWADVLG